VSVGTEAKLPCSVALVDETTLSVPTKVVGLPPGSKNKVNSTPVKVMVVVGETEDAKVSPQP